MPDLGITVTDFDCPSYVRLVVEGGVKTKSSAVTVRFPWVNDFKSELKI